jgi:LDH2 family malate/lactate/ureidoglycolate dehydrogenase
MPPAPDATLVSKHDLLGFATGLLTAATVTSDDARITAEGLVWSDLRGRHPQGVSRLPNFIQRVRRGLITSPADMRWTEAGPAAAILDADNALGHVAGVTAMRRAIDLARAHGVGVTAVRHSNLYGAAAYFCSLATDAHCLGFSCTNAVAKVAPFGGVRPVFGTNPLAFGCPTASGVPILVDFSTSAIAGSTARGLDEHGGRLPEGVALDKDGRPTTDPRDLAAGTLLPAAGAKGFGLALMVDILCGALAGAALSREVGSMYNTWDRPVNTGHFFLALDVARFASPDDFLRRVDMLLEAIRAAAPPDAPVRFPGEIRGALATRYAREGIPLPRETVDALTTLAGELGVGAPWG